MSWISAFYQGGDTTLLSGNINVKAQTETVDAEANSSLAKAVFKAKTTKAKSKRSSTKVIVARRTGKVE